MEYKGIYYGESKQQKFFEGGAHFKYSDLYRQLELLRGEKYNNENIRKKINENHNFLQIGSFYNEEKPIKNIIHTRNINKNYLNYPNTQITNFNRTMSNMDKYRKKSESKNLDINPSIETYQKINKINNISYIPNRDKLRNNSLASNNSNKNISRNKNSNLMNFQKSTENLNYTNNLILSLRMQIANNIKNKHQHHYHKNNSLENNKSPEYYIKYNNFIESKSRNKNSMGHLRFGDKKINTLTMANGNNDTNYEILFHRTMNHNKRIFHNNHFNYNINNNNNFNNFKSNKNIYNNNNNKNSNSVKKKLNDYINGKYQNKNLLYNKVNLDRFKSEDNIFKKQNLDYYKNLNLYK